jgi:hypothetical protein
MLMSHGSTRQLIADPQAASRLSVIGAAALALASLADKLDNAPLVTSSNLRTLASRATQPEERLI